MSRRCPLSFELILLAGFAALWLAAGSLDLWICGRNVRSQLVHSRVIPDGFEHVLSEATLVRMADYGGRKHRLHTLKALLVLPGIPLLLGTGLFGRIDRLLAFMPPVVHGLAFFAGIGLAAGLLSLPFRYHASFSIETDFDFCTQTPLDWWEDRLKEVVLVGIFSGILIGLILLGFQWSGDAWWLVGWLLLLGVQLLMVLVWPLFIAPLFNRFTPLPEGSLRDAIERLASVMQIDVGEIFVMDASRRTRHTNAYFTGFGKARRIVLYDLLVDLHTDEEILAILAHEAGHMKHHHIAKRLLLFALASLLLFAAAGIVSRTPVVFAAFGFEGPSAHATLFLTLLFWEPVSFFLQPLANFLSRTHENEADRYARILMGSGTALADALLRLGTDNLTNLHPDPLFVAFHHSHPPIVERVTRLRSAGRLPSSEGP